MAHVVSIRDWEKHFECAQSRKVTGPLTWFPMPTKHDGKCFRRIMARSDGPTIYACWVLICAVAAKATVRGRLADADGPLSAADLELKTGCKASHFEAAIKFLASKDIGWLVVDEWESSGSEVALQDRTVQDRTEQERCCAASSSEPQAASEPPVMVFPTVGESRSWELTTSHVATLRDSFPDLDVLGQCHKARGWCELNKRNRKTPRGMPRFLFSWMSRAQNSCQSRGATTAPSIGDAWLEKKRREVLQNGQR